MQEEVLAHRFARHFCRGGLGILQVRNGSFVFAIEFRYLSLTRIPFAEPRLSMRIVAICYVSRVAIVTLQKLMAGSIDRKLKESYQCYPIPR
jgi:hypothetical protein